MGVDPKPILANVHTTFLKNQVAGKTLNCLRAGVGFWAVT